LEIIRGIQKKDLKNEFPFDAGLLREAARAVTCGN